MRPPLAPGSSGRPHPGASGSGAGPSSSSSPPAPTVSSATLVALAGRALLGAALGFSGVALVLRIMAGLGPEGLAAAVTTTTASLRPPSSSWPPSCPPHTPAWHLAALDWGDGTEDGDAAGGRTCSGLAPSGAVNLAGTRHGGGCGASIGSPKVALLFLTKGAMPHDAMWAAWLEGAAGLVAADCAADAACAEAGGGTPGGAVLSRLQEECAAGTDPLSRQGLFSVYVHVPKGEALVSTAPGTPFTERTLIPGRVATEWGGFTLASATKALMRAALADRANARFALLSEACVPLYAPQVVYAQLTYNPSSRINACPDGAKPDWPLDHYRYTWRMEGATGGALTADKWRKSHQWVGLTRRHARAVADDVTVAAAFEKHCTNAMDPDRGVWRSCFSDEHYFATLLALRGWGEGPGPTDCEGDMTHTVWCRGGGCVGDAKLHPKHYNASEAGERGLLAVRRGGAAPGADCRDADAAAGAGRLVVAAAALGACRVQPSPSSPVGLMHGRCSLFARKFNGDVAGEVRDAVAAVVARDGRGGSGAEC